MTKTSQTAFLWFRSDNRKSAIHNPKWVGIFAIALTFVFGGAVAQAQQPTKVARTGFLIAASRSAISARTEAFQQGLRELGYVEGKNIVIEWRSAEGRPDRLPSVAAELVRLKVDVIVTTGSSVTRAAKEATNTIPIVMAQDNDPVGNGFVASLARPGGNITGLSTLRPEISGKQVELLKETVPRLSRVAVLGSSTTPGNAQALKETELAAGALGVKLQNLDVLGPKDIETAFRAAGKEQADAVLVLSASVLNSHGTEIAKLAVKSRLPAIYPFPEMWKPVGLWPTARALLTCSGALRPYVDKILNGANAADLPVEQPKKFECH